MDGDEAPYPPVALDELVGHWMALPRDGLWRLGESPETGSLGISITLGVHQILQLPDSELHHIVRQFSLEPSRLAEDITEALDRLPRGAPPLPSSQPRYRPSASNSRPHSRKPTYAPDQRNMRIAGASTGGPPGRWHFCEF